MVICCGFGFGGLLYLCSLRTVGCMFDGVACFSLGVCWWFGDWFGFLLVCVCCWAVIVGLVVQWVGGFLVVCFLWFCYFVGALAFG